MGTRATWWWRVGTIAATFQPPRDGTPTPSRASLATAPAVETSAANAPLVAVYFTGQARTLNRTLCSIRRRIFEPLIFAGYTPVVFVAGERDDEASDYERYLGAIRDVELGDVSIVPALTSRAIHPKSPYRTTVSHPPSPILSSRRPSGRVSARVRAQGSMVPRRRRRHQARH